MAGEKMISVELDVREVNRTLGKILSRTGNLKPAFEIIGETIKTSVVRNFEFGGRFSEPGSVTGGEKKWTPLALATLHSGRKKGGVVKKSGGDRHILIKQGHLMNSLNYRATSGGVEVGTNKIYGAIHNFGGMAGRGKAIEIPARPYLVVQKEDWEEMSRALLSHILGDR